MLLGSSQSTTSSVSPSPDARISTEDKVVGDPLPYALFSLVQLSVCQKMGYPPSSCVSLPCWVENFHFRRQDLVVKSLTPACLDGWRQEGPSNPLCLAVPQGILDSSSETTSGITMQKPQQTSAALFQHSLLAARISSTSSLTNGSICIHKEHATGSRDCFPLAASCHLWCSLGKPQGSAVTSGCLQSSSCN